MLMKNQPEPNQDAGARPSSTSSAVTAPSPSSAFMPRGMVAGSGRRTAAPTSSNTSSTSHGVTSRLEMLIRGGDATSVVTNSTPIASSHNGGPAGSAMRSNSFKPF